MSATAVTNYISAPVDPTGKSVEEILADVTLNTLKVLRDTIETYMEGTQGAERAKLGAVKKQIEDYIASLEAAKKAGSLAKVLGALGKIGVALAFVCAVVAPSPMTIGLLVVSLAMMLEPMISDAAGEKSLIESGMGEMFSWLNDQVGSTGAIVLMSLAMLAIVVASTAAVSAGVSAAGAAASSVMQALRNFVTTFTLPMIGTIQQSPKLVQFLELLQSTMMLAQGGVQIDMAILQLKAAELMKDSEVGQAVIDALVQMIKMAQQGTYDYKMLYDQIYAAMSDLIGPGPRY
jgi:hypothetical protein